MASANKKPQPESVDKINLNDNVSKDNKTPRYGMSTTADVYLDRRNGYKEVTSKVVIARKPKKVPEAA